MARCHAVGGSVGILLPKALREKMGFRRGDYLAIVVLGSRLIMRRVEREFVIDRDDEIPAVLLQDPKVVRGDA